MEDSGYQANAGDRCEMVTSPHDESPITLVTEEFRKRVQRRNDGDNTSSTVRRNDHFDRPRSESVTYSTAINKTSELQQLSAASVGVEQEAGNARPSTLSKRPRRTKSVKAPPRKKSGVNVETNANAVTINAPRRSTSEETLDSDKTERSIIVQPTDISPITSASRRPPTPSVKPKKRNVVKTSDQRVVEPQLDAQASLTEECVHDEGQITIRGQDNSRKVEGEGVQVVQVSSITETTLLQNTDESAFRSATCRPFLKHKSSKRFSSVCVSDNKMENNETEKRPKSMMLYGTEEVERQRSYELESSENKSKTQMHENVFLLQKPKAVSTQAERADILKQQETLYGYEATKELISDAGNDGCPRTTTEPRCHSDVAVKKSTLAVIQYTESEQFRQIEAAHKHELEEMEKVYKKKRKNLEDKYTKMVDNFKAQNQDKIYDLRRNYQNKHDEQRKQLTEKFNKALAVQSAEAQAERARLLTSADQARLDHQKQLEVLQQENDGLNRKVKQCELDKQAIDNQRCTTTNQQLETKSNYKDELAPYILTWLPELGEQHDSGSYGSVYRIQLYGICCIAKRIHDILLGQGKEKGVNLEDKRAAYCKFYHECVFLSRMRHPNIVQFMGVHYGLQRDYGKELTLVMERLYINLYDCLHRYPNIEMWQKVSILLDISQGLLHLHSRGIVHRDLTAPNILLTTSFHAKIADLGVSKIIQVRGTKQTMAPGNPDYMPPEALTEIPVYDYALDIFSFGVIMLFVLNQKYPKPYEVSLTVTGVERKEIQIQKRMKWIGKLSPEDPMRQLICRCLQDEPQKRPLSQELNSTLIHFAQQFPNPFVDTIEMQRTLKPPTTLPT